VSSALARHGLAFCAHHVRVNLSLLDPATEATLRGAPFTYLDVGATAGELPAGYPSLRVTKAVRSDFDTAVTALFRWQVQLGAGIRVATSSPTVEPDAVVMLRAGIGPVRLKAPCRIVYLVDEPDRKGFAYGTLPGHPEAGEELFLLERSGDDLTFTVVAFSRPASTLAKLGGPLGQVAQRVMARRYLAALH
jgi:uncharacterized protein (UPF0548 family)